MGGELGRVLEKNGGQKRQVNQEEEEDGEREDRREGEERKMRMERNCWERGGGEEEKIE